MQFFLKNGQWVSQDVLKKEPVKKGIGKGNKWKNKKFCEFCDSKGTIHKFNCPTRNQATSN